MNEEDIVVSADLDLHTGVGLSCYTRLSTDIGKHGHACWHDRHEGRRAFVGVNTCANCCQRKRFCKNLNTQTTNTVAAYGGA